MHRKRFLNRKFFFKNNRISNYNLSKTRMKKLEKLYEGKAKMVFKTDSPDHYIIEYKDDATAFDGKKKGTIEDKGVVNNLMSAKMFQLLEKQGIESHFVELINDRESIVKAVEIIKVEVIVRNVATGSMVRRLGVQDGLVLDPTVLEYCLKSDEYSDPLINDYHIAAMKLATEDEMQQIRDMAFKINAFMREVFFNLNLNLIDFKLEFGRYKGKILLADEISPDTCRFWEIGTNRKMDKDRFRQDLGNVKATYQEVLQKVQTL